MKNKINFGMLALTSVICLLPIVLALVLYNDLPEQMAMQWNLEGNPNWFAHKNVAVFGMPLFFVVLNIFTSFLFYLDPKRENASKAMKVFVQWIIPLTSILTIPILLFMAIGIRIPVKMIVLCFVGALLVIIGNYLPKNRQNYMIGIRIPWTLGDPENWNKTHRLAGYLWIFGGMAIIVMSFLPMENFAGLILLLCIIILLVIVPLIYSFSHYRKNKCEMELK